MTVEYKDSKRITAVSSDWTADVTSNITWSTTGKVGWDISGTTISRTGSAGWGTSKIQSTDTFTVGDGAFMIEFSGIHNDQNSTMIGFNKGTLGYYIGSPQNQNDFSIYVAGGSRVEVYESGSKNYDSGGSRNANDKFRIEVSNSGVVKYYLQEGGTGSFDLKHTSSSTASGTYFIQANAYASTSEVTVHSKTVNTAVAKPSNVQDNSILVEKDTARRYWFSEALAPTFENDFGTTSDWTKVGTTITVNDHVSGKCSINDPANSSSDRVYKSLGATLSDTAWVATCEINISAISGSERAFPVQFSSTTGSYRSSHDSIAIRLGGDLSGSSPSIGMSRNDGGTVTHLTDANSIQVSTGTLYYVKIWRDGSDLKLAVYTNSDYETGQVGSTQTHQSLGSPTGLSNVVIGSDDASTGGVNATVDNLKVYNNVTTATPATWNMQPTYQTDFSSSTGWVSSGAQAKIDSSGYLLFDDDSDGSAHKIYYDIGNTLSDTKWLWRFKLTTNTFSMNTDPTPQIVHMRISNKTDHRDSATEDAIGMSFRTSDGNQEYIRTTYSDGITFGTTGNFSTDMATGTHYVQITRDSSTQFTVKLYSDSSYSSLVESNSVTIPSTITDLRYLKIDNMTSDGTSNGRMIFHIDDMEVYSGVTSKN